MTKDRNRSGGFGSAPLARSAHDRARARQQFARTEGFGQIIVGAHFQANHAIDLVALGRQHQDRDRVPGAQPAADRRAVLAGKHQIEDDEIGPQPLQDACPSPCRPRRSRRRIPLGQKIADQPPISGSSSTIRMVGFGVMSANVGQSLGGGKPPAGYCYKLLRCIDKLPTNVLRR